MILADLRELTTALFPARVPEESEAQTVAESEAFGRWQRTPAGRAFYRALAHQAEARLAPRLGPDARVLSVGEGEGLFAASLAALRPDWELVGVDLCGEVVGRANAALERPANVRYVQGSVYALEGRWDAVLSVSSFHHFHDPAGALASMHAALAPGGVLYLLDLRRDAELAAYFRRLDQQIASGEAAKARLFRASVAASHTLAELRALLRPLGRPHVTPLRLQAWALRALAELGPERAVRATLEGLFAEAWLSARGGTARSR